MDDGNRDVKSGYVVQSGKRVQQLNDLSRIIDADIIYSLRGQYV